jgi:hypothetical protein
MTFTCTCIQCGKPFQAKRSTAKFCSPKCRVAYKRAKDAKKEGQVKKLSKKVTTKLPKVPVEDTSIKEEEVEDVRYIPNWKAAGFKNKDEAMIKAISDIAGLGYPNTLIVWKGEAFFLNATKKPVVIQKKRKKK